MDTMDKTKQVVETISARGYINIGDVKRVMQKYDKQKQSSSERGPSCSVPGKMHPILCKTGSHPRSHSIGTICPNCSISLVNYGEAVNNPGGEYNGNV